MWDTDIILIFLSGLIIVFLLVRNNRMPVFFRRLKYLFYSPNYYEAKLVREILSRKSTFFSCLSEKGKNRMIRKSIRFMMSKKFIGMDGLELTDEMIAEISGTAAQITFGLKKSGFSHFHTIKIFPESFYSRMFDRHLKGGASISGVLFFSWKDFQEGFADGTDRYNLGLHEMAHALRVELRYGSDFDQWFADYSDQWMKVALPEFQNMKHGKSSFLREYAGTNMEEFFSVCVEHFFEVPKEFRESLPDIFNHLCYLLRLDPTNTKNDYLLEEKFIEKINHDRSNAPIPYKVPKSYEYDTWHWSFNCILVGLFVAFPVILVSLPRVLIQIFPLLVICGAVVYIITRFRKFFHKRGILLFRHLVMFAIFGVSFPLIGSGLLANRIFATDPVTYTYKITGYQYRKVGTGRSEFVFTLSGNAYEHHRNARLFISTGPDEYFSRAQDLVLITTTGILGLHNIESRQLIIDNDTIAVPFPNF